MKLKAYLILLFVFTALWPCGLEAEEAAVPMPEEAKGTAVIDSLDKSANVTMDFKEADIRNVLKIISYKSGLNIVTMPEVTGNVTIRLVDVPWEKALDAIVKTNGLGYERQGNIITVAPLDKLASIKKQELALSEIQPEVTEVFHLKYIDAQDAKRAIEPQLSERGKITVLEMTGQAGWEFGGKELGKKGRSVKSESTEKALSRSRILIVSDIPSALNRIKEIIKNIDVMPQQVLIEARIMEVSNDKLRDIGFDWATGSSGAESSTITTTPVRKNLSGVTTSDAGGHQLGSQVKPYGFLPLGGTSAVPISSTEPFNMGFEFLYRKLTGAQFEVMLHALEEDTHTNTLSAPRIMALNNQEANILIGTRYPILKTDTTGAGSTAISTVTLDYYQDIGIQLNVVPQVGSNNYINMVVHPAVTSYTTTLGDNAYPIIDTREAETRILIKSGETVVIGGLLKDIKTKTIMGIPYLSKIPLLGILFKRETVDTQKVDLLVFITARVVKEGEFSPAEIAEMEERLRMSAEEAALMDKKKQKKGK